MPSLVLKVFSAEVDEIYFSLGPTEFPWSAGDSDAAERAAGLAFLAIYELESLDVKVLLILKGAGWEEIISAENLNDIKILARSAR